MNNLRVISYKNGYEYWNCYKQETDTEYFLDIDSDGTLWIIFKGSDAIIEHNKFSWDNLKDWIQNFMAWNVPYDDMKYKWYVGYRHYGLFSKWKSVRKDIHEFITENINNIDKIKIRGYSQGSALGVFCHEDLKFFLEEKHGINQIVLEEIMETIVAGCPLLFSPIGFKHVLPRIKDIIYLIHANDIVTKIPWWNKNGKDIVYLNDKNRHWWIHSIKDHYYSNYTNGIWDFLLEQYYANKST